MQIVRSLIQYGANVTRWNERGMTVVNLLLTGNAHPSDGKILQILLRSGANPNSPSFPFVDDQYEGRFTPIFQAIDRDDARLLTILLENGANPNVTMDGDEHLSPLLYAINDVRVQTTKVLIQKRLFFPREKQDSRELWRRLMGKKCKLLERNIAGDQMFYDEQMTSTEIRGRREILEAFIQSQLDLEHCNLPLGMAITQNCEEIAFMLINAGCLVNASYQRVPLLHWASMQGSSRLVGLMIERGVDVNVVAPKSGFTALHYATERDRLNIVEMLLDAGGASPSIKDSTGLTPLDIALQRNKSLAISKLLAEKTKLYDTVLIGQESSIKLEKN